MTEQLALKYRPQTFSDLVGQRINSVVLDRMVSTGNVPPALLFSGPSGVGKTTAARVLSASLGATDVIEIDAASNGGVEQVRKLLDVARYSTGGTYRVLVLDEAHSITRQGFEALLKTLEEPPANTVFVLVTTDPGKIPGTILSRLVEFQFRSISENEILDRLLVVASTESIQVDNDLLAHIVRRAAGNMRSALTSLDQVWRAGISTLEDFLELAGEHDPAPDLLMACASGDYSKVFEVLDSQMSRSGSPGQITSDLISCLRDLLVLGSGGTIAATGADYEVRKRMSVRIESERLIGAMRMLWEIKTKIRLDDPRSTLEMTLALITDLFTRGKDLPPKVVPRTVETLAQAAPRKMSLADLQTSASIH